MGYLQAEKQQQKKLNQFDINWWNFCAITEEERKLIDGDKI